MFTDDEKQYLKKLVEKDLEKFTAEEETIITNISPGFLKGEKKYEDFLRELIEKLK